MRHQYFSIGLCVPALLYATAASAQNAEPAKAKQPVAIVGGQTLYVDDLGPSVSGQLFQLRNQEYEIKKRALDNLIEQRLLESAASKKGLTTEQLLLQEVDANVPEPSEAELEGYYLGQRDRLNRPFNEVKDQLRQGFRQAKIQQARQDYLKALRKDTSVAILLTPPKVQVGYDPARLRGSAQAPVMIIEFSDFECPYCRQAEPTLKQLLARYGEKVSLAFRDFPLSQIHAQAELAAEASRCAGEQRKFWEYHDQVFSTPNLTRNGLLDAARAVKLDDKQFDSCLDSGKYKAEVQRDVNEGMRAGVSGTPAFFINGIPMSGSQPLDAFARAIDDELARKPQKTASSASPTVQP